MENKLLCIKCSSGDAYNILSTCLHAVCSVCLNSIQHNDIYICPLCSEFNKKSIYNSILSKCDSAPKSPNCAWCEANGEETLSVGECKECDAWLCGECFKGHKRMPPLRSHTINMLHKPEDQGTLRCELHPHEALECFCEACGILTCRDCQLSVHRDHGSHRWVGEKAMLLKSPLEAAMKKVEECQSTLQCSSTLAGAAVETTEGDCFLASVERARSDIEARTVSLIMQIRERANSLLAELNSKSIESIKLLEAAKRLMEQLNEHITSALTFTSRLLANVDRDPASLVQLADAVQCRLETLQRRACWLADDLPPSMDALDGVEFSAAADQANHPGGDPTAWRRDSLGWRRIADTRAIFISSWGGSKELDRQTGCLSWLPSVHIRATNVNGKAASPQPGEESLRPSARGQPAQPPCDDYLDYLTLLDAGTDRVRPGSPLLSEGGSGGPTHPVAGGIGCAICFGVGLLAHCGRCRRAYHLDCHLPRLTSISLTPGWVCGLCEDGEAATAAHVAESDGTGLSRTDFMAGCRILMGLLVHAEAVHFTASVCPACSVPLLTPSSAIPHCPAGHLYHRLAELRLQLEEAAGDSGQGSAVPDPASCSPPVVLVGGHGDCSRLSSQLLRSQRARLSRLDDWLIEVDKFWSDASREDGRVHGATKGSLRAARRIRASLASLIRLHRPESEASLLTRFAETTESTDAEAEVKMPVTDKAGGDHFRRPSAGKTLGPEEVGGPHRPVTFTASS